MKLVKIILFIVLYIFQEPELDTEFEPIEVYNFILILLGIILIIVILVYILLTSREE